MTPELKIDGRTRPLSTSDEELISGIERLASSSGRFVLAEVALGYIGRARVEGMEVTLTIRNADGGFQERTLLLSTARSVAENQSLVRENMERDHDTGKRTGFDLGVKTHTASARR